MKNDADTTRQFSELVAVVRRLREPSGCPWDRRQDTRSLTHYLQEEFNEIMEAIVADDRQNLCEELGDFLYLIIILAEINETEQHFSLADVVRSIHDKLIRRHPHVFAGTAMLDDQALTEQWQRIKQQEKAGKQ